MTSETTVASTVNQLRRPGSSFRGARSTAVPRRIEICAAGGMWRAAVPGERNMPHTATHRREELTSSGRFLGGKAQVPVCAAARNVVRGDALRGSGLRTRAHSDTLVSGRVDRSVFRCVRCGEFECAVEVTDPVPNGATAGNSLTLRDSGVRAKSRLPIADWLREFERGGIVIARPVDPDRELTDSAVPGNPMEKWFRSWDGKMVLVATGCVREFDDVATGSFTRMKRTVNVIRRDVIGGSPSVRQVRPVVRSDRRHRIPPARRG